jgi:hypothetical protein
MSMQGSAASVQSTPMSASASESMQGSMSESAF